ncbi:isopentenyl-diphosphate delta-isomerase 1 [Stylonychia lemnae]|uniref:isopentenyl-diphosphate Delta-isomerase n=1 Tax=Stylonychia lemnae TaxID=5949 RepID=A0A078A8F6_STYLE|nr:isopentenyl-diphosphate delta-isomerase 1 [Stylonychia lemnae]|eukprot:CDW78509.1 isopentenyl-diphosphate delta-isomerase 1 [Stylonychia lemnae]
MSDMITLVDENDNVIGPISKIEAHMKNPTQNQSQSQSQFPHRAFSLLLFNSKNQLLLQQRSYKKITFPSMWTNTCCSHNAHIPEEITSEQDFIGIRRAAVRRSKFELGISELDPNLDLKVVSRILYYADNCDKFAEHELDYIIFAKKNLSQWNPKNNVNADEIHAIDWVGLHEIEEFLESKKQQDGKGDVTPWFRLLKDSKLKKWWTQLIDEGTFPDEAKSIHRFY